VNREDREAAEVRDRKAAEEAKREARQQALEAAGGIAALQRQLADVQAARRAVREEARLATEEHLKRGRDLAQEEQHLRFELAFFEGRQADRARARAEQALSEARGPSWNIPAR
jgi:multidrug efflux pump subunit AcrA (membrane-fusion protein)